jgi:hypothetical protein
MPPELDISEMLPPLSSEDVRRIMVGQAVSAVVGVSSSNERARGRDYFTEMRIFDEFYDDRSVAAVRYDEFRYNPTTCPPPILDRLKKLLSRRRE